jgi:hypothetical protein
MQTGKRRNNRLPLIHLAARRRKVVAIAASGLQLPLAMFIKVNDRLQLTRGILQLNLGAMEVAVQPSRLAQASR